jgi:hydrogenase nickel incorporation protein HypA/HybF
MHEVSLMQRVLEIARAEAQRHGAERVHRLRLRVGPLAGVVPEALEFAFDVVMRGTMVEGAALEVEYLPWRGRCPSCGTKFEPAGPGDFGCPSCGFEATEILGGRELELVSLEVSGAGSAGG